MTADFERARLKYKPRDIKYLLVAEAPPREGSGRFFYFEDVPTHDSLFLETMKVLYPKDCIDTRHVRENKARFLKRFMDDGFYLIDSTDMPIIDVDRKEEQISTNLASLCRKISRLVNDDTKIVLISKTVYDVCFHELKSKGYNVINKEMIDFPGSGGQAKFRNKMLKLLKSV